MTWRPPFTPRVVWLNDDSEDEDEEEKEVEAAPASQHEEVQEHQLLQAGQWPGWAAGRVAAAGWDHPRGHPQGKRGRGDRAVPHAGLWPCSIHGHSQPHPAARETGVSVPTSPCHGARLCSPASPAAPQLCPRLVFARSQLGAARRGAEAGRHPCPAQPQSKGTRSQPCSRCPAKHRCWALGVASFSSLPFLFPQLFWETVHPKDCEGSTVELAEAMTEGQSYDAEAGAALLDMLVESEISTLKQVSSLWPELEPTQGSCGP